MWDDDDDAPSIQQFVSRLLNAGKGESIEATINAACELVYQSSLGESALRLTVAEWGATDDEVDPLRVVSQSAARRIARELDTMWLRFSPRDVFEELLRLRNKRLARAGLNLATEERVARLMGALSGPGESLLDPACGLGGTLMYASERAPRTKVSGIDINAETAHLALRRLALAEVPNAEISIYDWLEDDPVPEWDSVVLDPPFGGAAGQRNNDMLWLSSAADSLKPNGRAVVLMPSSSASRANSKEARNSLLGSGRVIAIISLAAGSALGAGVSTCLWVVGGSADPRRNDQVLLINGSSVLQPDSDGSGLDSIVAITVAWADRIDFEPIDPWVAALVPAARLVDEGTADPHRFLSKPPSVEAIRPAPTGRLLTEIRIANFKSIAGLAKIPLRPLTLIFGQNSAGKSSVLQALLLLKQSIDQQRLIPVGPLVDLGSFASLVHRHETGGHVELGIDFASSREIDSSAVVPDPGRARSVDLDFRLPPDANDAAAVGARIGFGDVHFSFAREGDGSYAMQRSDVSRLVDLAYLEDTTFPPRRSSSRDQGRRVLRALIGAGMESVQFDSSRLPPGTVSRETLSDLAHFSAMTTRPGLTDAALRTAGTIVQAIGDEASALLDRVVYLGPLRQPPERISQRGSRPASLDVPFFLLDNISERELVSAHLQRLGVNYDLDVRSFSADDVSHVLGDIAAIILTDRRTNVQVSPADVGFGVSQVLPIVVELSARANSIILIEQPEIHLHPALQADLADLLIESTNESGRANQVIAETHSESLMLRVQRRVRDGGLDPADLAVLYVDQDHDGNASIRELRVDSKGDFLDDWPHGFFVERFDELFGALE